MVYYQTNIPRPNKVYSFSTSNFAGGLNNRSEFLEPDQAYDLLNVRFLDDTSMEKRKGIKSYNSLALDSPISFIDEFRPYTDLDAMLYGTNTTLYKGDEAIKTVGGQICGTNYKGRYHFVDGQKYYVYGKFPQTGSTYEAIVGTAVDQYMVMEVQTPGSYTPLPSPHIKGVTRYNYTDKVITYEPCKFEEEDTSKGKNVLPEHATFMVVHDGRIFMSGSEKDDDNVFITDADNAYYFPVTLPMQLPPNSDKVRGLIVYDDGVVIGRQRDVYTITGKTNNPQLGFELFKLRKLNTHTGFANHRCAQVAHNYLFFLGSDGNAYSLASIRNDEKLLATTILTQTVDLFRRPFKYDPLELPQAVGYFWNDEWYISLKDLVLVYSYRHRAWTVFNHMHSRSFFGKPGIFIWGTEEGKVEFFGEDFYDKGIPFRAFWTSGNFDMGEPSAHKLYREFYIVAHTYENFISDINVTFEIDFADVKDSYSIQNQIAIYGRSRWGDRYANRNIVESMPFLIGRRGRLIRFTLYNSYDPSAPVADYDELENYLGRKNGTLVYVTNESSYYLYDGTDWNKVTEADLNQPMRWYQVNGEYELRGKR